MTLAESTELSARSTPREGAGHGHIKVELVSEQSAATSVEARSPLKILVPRPRGKSVWCYLSNFGGGLLPGDELDVSLTIAKSARCFLGTQSSTKIFRSGPKGAVKNNFRADVAPGALLVYAPDVAQGFADSRYIQHQSIRLADETSSLVFLDWYSSGRSARGERWAFAEYTSRNEIRVRDKLTYLDSIRLGADSEVSLPDRMARVNCLATVVIIGAQLEQYITALFEEVSQLPLGKRADALIVASRISNGAVFRIAGISVEAVARQIFPRLAFIAPLLGDNPFQRKW